MAEQKTQAYAAINKADAVRKESTSGGVFTLLAEAVLAQGGAVFGAAVTEDLRVAHIIAETSADLQRLRGSKYVRSHLGKTYAQAQELLESGRQVLFSGTPCQIGGLKAYLKKEYDNLLCVDLICHGAPMADVWAQYVQYRQEKAGAKATGVNFRDKTQSWRNYNLTITFDNGTAYSAPMHADPYMQVFLRDLSLGTSCYSCSCKGIERQADITLADFWGVENTIPQMFDDKGTSLVFTHSEKGQLLLDSLKENMQICPADVDTAVSYNPAMIHSAKKPANREAFLEDLKHMDFQKAAQKHLPKVSPIRRILRKIKKLLHM